MSEVLFTENSVSVVVSIVNITCVSWVAGKPPLPQIHPNISPPKFEHHIRLKVKILFEVLRICYIILVRNTFQRQLSFFYLSIFEVNFISPTMQSGTSRNIAVYLRWMKILYYTSDMVFLLIFWLCN